MSYKEDEHDTKIRPKRKGRDSRHLPHFYFSNSRQSSFSFLTHFLSSAGLIVYVVWPILFTHCLPSTYPPFTIFLLPTQSWGGRISILIFLIISRGANIHFRIAAHINSPPQYSVCPPLLVHFAFSFTMTCCRIWDQHSSAHEHAHNWVDTPFHPFTFWFHSDECLDMEK